MRVDLFQTFPRLKKLVKMRGFQFFAIFPNFLIFYFLILAGLLGTPVGNQNILIVFVWILWWVLLIGFLVPLGSRVWCLACPLPVVGEWLQRLRLVGVRPGQTGELRNRLFGLNKSWPKRFRSIWIQNIGFLCMATISALLVTRPIVSVFMLGGLILLAIVFFLIFRQRAFCMYLCPVGGFLSLYSMTATVGVRSKDPEVCRVCKHKNCLRGSEKNYGCPWFQYIGNMERNNYCGMCMECVKNCPHDNVALNLRGFAKDTKIKGLDEAWKAFIMLALAMVYSVTLLGPWGTVKDWANVSESGDWGNFLKYAGIIFFAALAGLPSLYYLAIRASKWIVRERQVALRDLFLRYSYTMVPLGLLAWIAFSVPLVMVNGSYIVTVISDPMGWGWDLLGTAGLPWAPFKAHMVPYLQVPLLLVGLSYSIWRGCEIGEELLGDRKLAVLSMIPVTVLLVAVTGVFLRLFAG